MARRTREAALETRERILDAAIEVFHARGVARPSLTDVAQLAGVTRGAVYVHFQNKADLFSALCDRVQLPTEAIAESALQADSSDPLGQLRASWVYLLRRASSDDDWRRILDIIYHRCEIMAESGEILQRMQRGQEESLTRLERLLRQAVELGQLPPELDVDQAAPVLHAGLSGLLGEWLFQPEAYKLSDRAERYVDAMLAMLQSPALRRR